MHSVHAQQLVSRWELFIEFVILELLYCECCFEILCKQNSIPKLWLGNSETGKQENYPTYAFGMILRGIKLLQTSESNSNVCKQLTFDGEKIKFGKNYTAGVPSRKLKVDEVRFGQVLKYDKHRSNKPFEICLNIVNW